MPIVVADGRRGREPALRVRRPGSRRNLSRSATRALDVLEYFGAARRPLRAIEIAQSLGAHPSTTNQLLKTMIDSAHLVFDARAKTYLPSPRLAEFGSWIVESYGAGGRFRTLIQDMQRHTGFVVTVTTPNDLFMQVIDGVSPDGRTAERGLQVSLFGTAIGSAHLSTLDEAEVLRLSHRARVPDEEVPSILETLARIREAGFADGPSASPEVWSVAVPVASTGLRVPTVLGLAGPAEQVRERVNELAKILRAAIAERFAP